MFFEHVPKYRTTIQEVILFHNSIEPTCTAYGNSLKNVIINFAQHEVLLLCDINITIHKNTTVITNISCFI